MKKNQHLDLVALGKPSLSDLNENQQKHFYVTLLKRIQELKNTK